MTIRLDRSQRGAVRGSAEPCPPSPPRVEPRTPRRVRGLVERQEPAPLEGAQRAESRLRSAGRPRVAGQGAPSTGTADPQRLLRECGAAGVSQCGVTRATRAERSGPTRCHPSGGRARAVQRRRCSRAEPEADPHSAWQARPPRAPGAAPRAAQAAGSATRRPCPPRQAAAAGRTASRACPRRRPAGRRRARDPRPHRSAEQRSPAHDASAPNLRTWADGGCRTCEDVRVAEDFEALRLLDDVSDERERWRGSSCATQARPACRSRIWQRGRAEPAGAAAGGARAVRETVLPARRWPSAPGWKSEFLERLSPPPSGSRPEPRRARVRRRRRPPGRQRGEAVRPGSRTRALHQVAGDRRGPPVLAGALAFGSGLPAPGELRTLGGRSFWH